jgi:protein-disulfide isomerase
VLQVCGLANLVTQELSCRVNVGIETTMDFYRRAYKHLCLTLGALAIVGMAHAAEYSVYPDDRTMGSVKAPVVLIEYAAPVCPHCARFSQTVFPEIKKAYVDTGKVLYVLRIFPLSQWDGAVAGMANCMPPKKYLSFIDLAFKNQSVWDPDGNDISDVHAGLVQLGKLAGLNPKQVDRCMADPKEQERVNRIAQDGEKKYSVASVPTLVVNGTVVQAGEAGWPELQARIDGLLAAHK